MEKSRKKAIEKHEQYYKTGEKCKHGHISKRDTVYGACCECRYYNNKKERIRIRELLKNG